jgi:hypothetical protein
MVPLSESLYVPATLADTEAVLVDVGTGYYVQARPRRRGGGHGAWGHGTWLPARGAAAGVPAARGAAREALARQPHALRRPRPRAAPPSPAYR